MLCALCFVLCALHAVLLIWFGVLFVSLHVITCMSFACFVFFWFSTFGVFDGFVCLCCIFCMFFYVPWIFSFQAAVKKEWQRQRVFEDAHAVTVEDLRKLIGALQVKLGVQKEEVVLLLQYVEKVKSWGVECVKGMKGGG